MGDSDCDGVSDEMDFINRLSRTMETKKAAPGKPEAARMVALKITKRDHHATRLLALQRKRFHQHAIFVANPEAAGWSHVFFNDVE